MDGIFQSREFVLTMMNVAGRHSAKSAVLWIAAVSAGIAAVFWAWWKGAFLPRWILWNKKELHDGESNRVLVLKNQSLVLAEEERVLWESDSSWLVSDVEAGDIDNDGTDEVLLLVWKHGNYGRSHPIYEKGDAFHWYEHLYIYDADGAQLKARWMSSALRPEIRSFEVNENGLIVCVDPDEHKSVWKWENRGLYRSDLEQQILQ